MPEALKLLETIALQIVPFELIAMKYANDERFVDVEYERTDGLIALQNRVLAAFNPIRDGMRAKDAARLAEATGIARQNLEQYGYRGIGSLFRPHITLARTKSEQNVAVHELASISKYNGAFSEIGLFEMGDNGACIRRIAVIDLKGESGVSK